MEQKLRNARFQARVFFSPPPGSLSRAARYDKDAGESAAGRAIRVLRAAPTKGSSPAAPRLRCVGARAASRLPFPAPGELETVRSPRGGEAGGWCCHCRPAQSREAAPRPNLPPAPAGQSSPRAAHRAPPHPVPPPPAHSARPPRTGPGSPCRRRLSPRSRSTRSPAAPRAPRADPLQPRPPALAPASLLRRASPPAAWPIGGHRAAAVAFRIARPLSRSAPFLLQPKGDLQGGSREGSLGCAEHVPSRWRGFGK